MKDFFDKLVEKIKSLIPSKKTADAQAPEPSPTPTETATKPETEKKPAEKMDMKVIIAKLKDFKNLDINDLLGKKKNTSTTGTTGETNAEGQEPSTFEIYDPGSSFNRQTAFLKKEKNDASQSQLEIQRQKLQEQLSKARQVDLTDYNAMFQNSEDQGEQEVISVKGDAPVDDKNASKDENAVENPDDAGAVVKEEKPIISFRYTIVNSLGKKESGTFEAENENEVRTFLTSQDYKVLDVRERSKFDIDIGAGGKMKAGDLSFALTQLSTYIRSGIPLADSVKILAKQARKPHLKKSFYQLEYQLLKGENFSSALKMQENFYPQLLINMVKTSEMTGDLPSILDDMAEYYTSMDQTRKQMKSAMTYPSVVLSIAVGVLVFMLTYLVPQFTAMFEEQGAELPALTKAIVAVSEFIKTKWYLIILTIAVIVGTFILCYKKIQPFRRMVQIVLMHMPVFGNIIIYNETANFTKTFSSLINHGVFITDSMEILSKITTNEIYKAIISSCLENLARGDSLSTSFKGQWAFPIVAYEMIVTGESTGQLGEMMEKVAAHFQMLHKNVIDTMKSLVEPFMIIFLAGIVGVILVSIIQPMFSIYSQIK